MPEQVLVVNRLAVRVRPGLEATDLVDKIDELIRDFALDDDWSFLWDIEE